MINTGKLAGRTIFITGASRGIGKAIALKVAKDGANVVIAAKTAEPHPKLPGTIYTTAEEVKQAGGIALPCVVDVRSEEQVRKAVSDAVSKFGGIDILVNNASAISLTGTLETDMKRYDLMHNINTRGTFLVSKECMPYLLQSNHAHILNISPPLNLNPLWFANHVAYTISKYGMSMCVLGMAKEYEAKISVNALWPRTAIHTAAIEMLSGPDSSNLSRKPEIMADAAYVILSKEPKSCTGKFFIDDEVLFDVGVSDLKTYACNPENVDNLMDDFFLEPSKEQQNETTPLISNHEIRKMFSKINTFLNEDLVDKTRALYQFNIQGEKKETWFLDLKSGSGKCGHGEPSSKPDATLIMSNKDFIDMFTGKLKPTPAFISGKLKIRGDMQKAMKLEKLMNNLKSKL